MVDIHSSSLKICVLVVYSFVITDFFSILGLIFGCSVNICVLVVDSFVIADFSIRGLVFVVVRLRFVSLLFILL